MRTITENLKSRLVAQAEEAKIQGLTKLASHLTTQAERNSLRKTAESYTYSSSDFQNDIESQIWFAATRFADFHNVSIDGSEIQSLIEKTAKNLIAELRAKTGTIHGIGAYEPTIPGELRQTLIEEVSEDE